MANKTCGKTFPVWKVPIGNLWLNCFRFYFWIKLNSEFWDHIVFTQQNCLYWGNAHPAESHCSLSNLFSLNLLKNLNPLSSTYVITGMVLGAGDVKRLNGVCVCSVCGCRGLGCKLVSAGVLSVIQGAVWGEAEEQIAAVSCKSLLRSSLRK